MTAVKAPPPLPKGRLPGWRFTRTPGQAAETMARVARRAGGTEDDQAVVELAGLGHDDGGGDASPRAAPGEARIGARSPSMSLSRAMASEASPSACRRAFAGAKLGAKRGRDARAG